jgi:hypothetical protein
MNVRRTAAASLAAALTFGGASVAWAAESPTTTTDPTTTTPVVAPQDFSVTLAGLGDVVITVDPATGAIQKVVVTPIDGVTAGDPVPVHNGIQIDFTMADGTVRTAILEVEAHHGQVRVEVEAPEEHEQGNDNHQGPPPISDRGVSEDHRNDDHDRQGPDATTPPTTPTTPTPPTTENHGSGGEGGQSSSNSSGGNGHNGSGGRD